MITGVTMNRSAAKGMTLIELLVVVSIIGVMVALLLPAVQATRERLRRTQCSNHLRQLNLALANYISAFGVFPFGVGGDGDRRPDNPSYASDFNRRYSSHSQLLPFLEQQALFDRINFTISPFYPDLSGDPDRVTGMGDNEWAAQQTVPLFLCPSDSVRMGRPWGQNSYRTCTGSNWNARTGNGVFGQRIMLRPAALRSGMSNVATFSERVMGSGQRGQVELVSDLWGDGSGDWTESGLAQWCGNLSKDVASGLPLQDVNSGMTWLEGNMNWTRYNHVLPPGKPSCKNQITWLGVVMTASSRHRGGVNLGMADGSVRFVDNSIDIAIWRSLATIRDGD